MDTSPLPLHGSEAASLVVISLFASFLLTVAALVHANRRARLPAPEAYVRRPTPCAGGVAPLPQAHGESATPLWSGARPHRSASLENALETGIRLKLPLFLSAAAASMAPVPAPVAAAKGGDPATLSPAEVQQVLAKLRLKREMLHPDHGDLVQAARSLRGYAVLNCQLRAMQQPAAAAGAPPAAVAVAAAAS